jgi:fatty-acyl-CoA synthase
LNIVYNATGIDVSLSDIGAHMNRTPESLTHQDRRSAMNAWIRALDYTKNSNEASGVTLCGMLDDLADTHGERVALLGEGEQLSYRELAARANRYARWAIARGFVPGDVICLMMANCPEYVAIWLGLTRAGCAVALLNTNLLADPLLHSIRTVGPAGLIVGDSLVPPVAALIDQLPPDLPIWQQGASRHEHWPVIGTELARYDGAPLSIEERPPPKARDRALLIYTSGTTGLPKAANITHARVMEWSFWFAGMMDTQPGDRMYDCLPMYHSVGGLVAIGALLVKGGSVLIRGRFSASRFWDDVVDGDCTIFQYIGELCRYLAISPPHPKERLHRLRLACGNGLQGDVWEIVQRRFAIPRILEFYAATEGSVSLYNCEGKVGAIGRVPPFLAHRFPVALIRCDPDTGTPLRDAAGFCIACGPDEVGEAIGQVHGLAHGQGQSPARQFDGYTDERASAAKLLHGVFTSDDCWYRTGDLMRKDASGYFYFVDRSGDTFRWKGENVSTTEVAAAIRAFPGVTEAVVFGVTVPGHEGRAGMAAITTDATFDITGLRAHLSATLPGYAQPLFVRCSRALDVTGTFKLVKGKLVEEGYMNTDDPVWFNDRVSGQFVICDAGVLRSINEKTLRL